MKGKANHFRHKQKLKGRNCITIPEGAPRCFFSTFKVVLLLSIMNLGHPRVSISTLSLTVYICICVPLPPPIIENRILHSSFVNPLL